MSVNIAEMERRGWGRNLALLAAAGYRCVHDNDDGKLPVAIFAKIDDGMVYIIQAIDFIYPDDDRHAIIFPVESLEAVASAVMGMIMAGVDSAGGGDE